MSRTTVLPSNPTAEGRLTYDPRRLQGVTVYRDTERAFAKGEVPPPNEIIGGFGAMMVSGGWFPRRPDRKGWR
jgi:hypothetical protein